MKRASPLLLLVLAVPAAGQTPKEAVLIAITAETAAHPKRISVQMRLDGKEVEQNWDVVAPDRFLFRQRSAQLDLEMCVIGRTAYLHEAAGWFQAPLGPASVPVATVDWVRNAFDNTLRDVALLGEETVGGQPAKRYSAQVQYRDQFGAYEGRADVWIATDSNLPVRATFTGTYGERPFSAEKTVYYDSTLTLEAPPILNP